MDELAKRFAELAEKFGPLVIEAAKDAVRVEAYSSMVSSGLGLIVALALTKLGTFLLNKGMNHVREDYLDDSKFGYYIGATISLIIAAIIAVICVDTFVSPWTWTALNHPEIWLARRVFKL